MSMKIELSSADDVMDFIKVLFVASEIIVKQAEEKAMRQHNAANEIVEAIKAIKPAPKVVVTVPATKRGRPAKKTAKPTKE